MPTSSLFLRSGPMAKFAVLSLIASGAAAQYTLSADYSSGGNFFDNFDFDVGSPSDGYITYQNQVDAANNGLIYTADGVNYIAVDPYAPDQAPAGVRIISKDEYTHGLFVANILNMPGGYCGVEGLYATQGTGEIDIITGEGEATLGTYDVQTPGTCSTPVSFTDANPYSFGDPFNQNGGGIYATNWDSNSIKIWFWSADMTAPSDIFSASPDPTTWGPPIADFEGCNDDTNFKNNRIVFDTNFCNAAANAAFAADSTCSSSANSCQEFITQFPSAYDQSYWAIQSLMVYEYTGDSVAAVSTAAASSSTSAAASSTSISMPTGTPAIVPVVGAYSYTGCVDDIDTRLLTGDHTASDTMTIEDCASYCSGYQYFGLEYTRECYCGNSFSSPGGADTVNPDSACSLTCMGNPTEFCGGSMLLSLYELTADLPVASPSAAASSTVVPAAASSTIIPAAASSTVVPAAASSTVIPAAASSTVVPAAASSTVIPAAASSTIIPDGQAGASSTIIPAAASSSIIPAAASSTIVPAAASSTVIPAVASSTIVPAAASSTIVPAAASSTVVPDAAASTAIYAAASSTVAAASSSTPDSAASSSAVPSYAAASSTSIAAASSSTPDSAASSTASYAALTSSGYASGSGSAYPTAAMTSVVAPYANSSIPTMTKAGNYSASLVLSTVYSTSVYTITSCAATVTNCPARIGSVTTDIISLYTTWCPGNPTITPTPTPYSQKAVEAYTTVVITSYVDYCPGNGQLTTITYSQTQVLSASPTYEAAIPMYTTTKTWTNAGGETVCATLTIPSGAPVPTPETPSYPGSPAPVVTAGTMTFTVVPVQSAPVYPAAPVYPGSNSNATANAGIYGAASGTAAVSDSKSTYMATSGAGAKEFSFGAAVCALGAVFALL